MKVEYENGPIVAQKFEEAMKILFQTPKQDARARGGGGSRGGSGGGSPRSPRRPRSRSTSSGSGAERRCASACRCTCRSRRRREIRRAHGNKRADRCRLRRVRSAAAAG